MASEINSIGRQVNGQLRKPDRPIPILRPYRRIDKKSCIDPWRKREPEIVDGVAKAEMAVILPAFVSADGDGLPCHCEFGLLVQDFIIQRVLQLVRMEIDVYSRKYLSA
jgi:hypothetical protein